MRLSDEELQASNEKSMALYKELIEKGSLGSSLGIKVSLPKMDDRTIITPACLPIRSKRKKTSAMQKRTGPYSMSLAKEQTRYDHLISDSYQDNTDYEAFDATDGIGTFIPAQETKKEEIPELVEISMGVLDL